MREHAVFTAASAIIESTGPSWGIATMPLYEYKCGSCGNIFEVIQKFSDQPLTIHESCGGVLERLISTSALQFKGSGWYVNDYGKGNSKEPKPKSDNSHGESKSEKSNGTQAAESSGKSEKSEKSEKSSKSESSSSTSSDSSSSKSDTKKSDSK
jgi:putative FmdB family regulatory protein